MRYVILLVGSALASAPAARAQTPSPQALVRRAVTAMGGEQALRGLASVSQEFTSASFGLGQEEGPLAQARGTVSWGRIVTDWRGNRRFTSQEVRAPTGVVTRQRQMVANGIAMNETGGTQSILTPALAAGILQGMRLQPDRMLLRALNDPAVISAIPPKTFRGEVMDGVRFAQGSDTLALYFDRLSGLLTVSDLVTDDPILGDRHTLTWYTRWNDAGGIKLPRQFDTEVNGRLLSHNSVTALTINGTLSDTLFAIPDSMARRAQPAAVAPPAVITVTMVELAPGVWRAEGGTHHSLVVDQGARLVMVEAPQSMARTQAVLDTLKRRFPGKPIGLVVNTHHHWDHAGGLRTAMNAGYRIVTHQRNVAFVRGVGTATKTVARDAISRGKPLPVITPVKDSMVIGTGDRRVVLYEVPTTHVQGLLAAYVPSARVLFTADVVNPPAPPVTLVLPQPGSAELVAFAKAHGLSVDRYVGAHGIVVAWSEIEKAAR